jgi:hypothetical protein
MVENELRSVVQRATMERVRVGHCARVMTAFGRLNINTESGFNRSIDATRNGRRASFSSGALSVQDDVELIHRDIKCVV